MLDFICHFASLATIAGAWSQVKVDSSKRSGLQRSILDALEEIRATVTVPTVPEIRQAVAV